MLMDQGTERWAPATRPATLSIRSFRLDYLSNTVKRFHQRAAGCADPNSWPASLELLQCGAHPSTSEIKNRSASMMAYTELIFSPLIQKGESGARTFHLLGRGYYKAVSARGDGRGRIIPDRATGRFSCMWNDFPLSHIEYGFASICLESRKLPSAWCSRISHGSVLPR